MPDLFSTIKTCDYCKLAPKPKEHSPHIFNGYRDIKTGHLVCWNCTSKHDEFVRGETLKNL